MKRKRRNPTKAELEAEANFAKMMAKWDKMPKFSSSKRTVAEESVNVIPVLDAPPGRFTSHGIPSRATPGGSTAKVQSRAYTGDKVLGIATLHKSIAQPVFSSDEAKDVARMRRN